MDEDVLKYMITAYDLATPVFKAFGGQVEATSKQVQASLAEMNKAMATQQAEMDKMVASQKEVTATQAKSAESMGASAAGAAGAKGHHENLGSAMDNSAASAAGLTTKEKDLKAATADTTAELDKHKAALSDTVGLLNAAGASSIKVKTAEGEVSAAFKDTTGVVEKHGAAISSARRDTEGLGYAMSGLTGQMGPLGTGFDNAAKHASLFREKGVDYAAAGVVAMGAAFVVEGVRAAASFDKLTAGMQAQTGVTRAQATGLVNIVKDVATQSVGSYQEIAGAVGAEYTLFGHNAEMIKKNTDLFVAFASQAGTPTQSSVQQLSQIMRQFHPVGMNVVDMMDQLVNLAQKTQQPLQGYVQVLTQFGPQLNAMGIGFKGAEGMFASFSKEGVGATGVGRGLTSSITFATKAIQDAQSAAVAGGKGGMEPYTVAIETAKGAVGTLGDELAKGSISQSQYNADLVVANQHLDMAKDKYTAMAQMIEVARQAHMKTSGVIAIETKNIEDSKTKTDALNLSIEVFGKRLGPAMADALYHNKQGLDAMSTSLGSAKGKTEDLAKAQRDTLSGQLTILEHDFTNIAGTFGNDLLPLLKDGAGVLETMATGIAQFSSGSTKGLAEVLAALGVTGGVVTLAARHTPLGALTSHLPGVGGFLSKQGGSVAKDVEGVVGGAAAESTSGMWGVRGKMMVGSVGNPLAVQMVTGMSGGAGKGTPEETEGAPAERVAPAAEPVGGAAVGGEAVIGEEVAAPGLMSGLGGAAMAGGAGILAGAGIQAATGLRGGAVATAGGGVAGAVAGGALGAIGGPMGMMIGSALGGAIGSSLGPTIGHALASVFGGGESYGNKLAGDMSKGFGKSTDMKTTVAKLLDDAAALNHPQPKTVGPQGPGGSNRLTAAVETPEQIAKAKADQYKAGTDVAAQLEAGWNQYKFQSEPVMFEQFKAEAGKLPPVAQASALQSALAFANKLTDEGRLSKGSAAAMVQNVEEQFPGLVQYLGVQGTASAATLTKALDFTQTETNVKAKMTAVGDDFASVRAAMDDTSGNTTQKAAAMITSLRNIAETGTKPMRAQAEADITSLLATFQTSFTSMDNLTTSKMSDISGAVKSGSQSAASSAKTYWGQYQSTVQNAETAGVLTVQQGNKMIAEELAKALQALGVPAGDAKKLAAQGWSVGAVSSSIASINASGLGATTSSGALAVNAMGGRVPGSAGPDNWTLVDPNGNPAAMVAGAELIANRHTEARVNQMLAPYGTTLGAQVAGETVPHYATGGVVGQIDSFFGAHGFDKVAIAGIVGNAMQESSLEWDAAGGGMWQQISNFGQGTGGSPDNQMSTMLGQIGGIKGALNSASSPASAADIFEASFERAGIPALAARERYAQEAFAGDALGGGGGGGASYVPIKAPHVSGGGDIGAVDQGILNQVTAAANIKLAAAAAAAAAADVGGGGGGTMTFQKFKGNLPDPVQKALQTAEYEVSRHIPYGTGEFGAYYGVDAPSLDCSGFVSTVLNAAGLDAAGHLLTGGLKQWGDPGPGRYITVGILGADSGPTGHTMMEITNRYFESGGGGGGPHEDPGGWSSTFPWKRHPPGLARGGRTPKVAENAYMIGVPGHQPTQAEFAAGFATGGVLGDEPWDKKLNDLKPTKSDRLFHVGAGAKVGTPAPATWAPDFATFYHQTWQQLSQVGAIPSGFSEPQAFVDVLPSLGSSSGLQALPYTNLWTHQSHFPTTFVPEVLNSDDPNNDWARQVVIHEMAHTMQSAATINAGISEMEGGAQAWADQRAPQVLPDWTSVGDSSYAGYVQQELKLGYPWIDTGQFTGPMLSAPAMKRATTAQKAAMPKHALGYAGAFGDGGSFTATGPTLALFGDKGIEHVMAIPHSQTANQVAAGYNPGTAVTKSSTAASKAATYSSAVSPLTGNIESHTAAEWLVIRHDASEKTKAAAAARKALATHLAGQVTLNLGLGGVPTAAMGLPGQPLPVGLPSAGQLQQSRKSLGALGLPQGGTFDVTSGHALGGLTDKGLQAVLTALTKALTGDTLKQSTAAMNKLTEAVGHEKGVGKERGTALANAAQGVVFKALTTQFTQQQTQQSDHAATMTSLEGLGLGAGQSMNLSNMQLKALGISRKTARGLAHAGTTGPAADAAQVAYISGTELPADTADAKKLQTLYKAALKTHNTKLQASLLTQLDAVTKAAVDAQAALKAAQVAAITDSAAASASTASEAGGLASLVSGIQNSAPGSASGFTAQEMAYMNPGGADTGTAGTGMSYLQGLITSSGAPLSAAQMSGAAAGVGTANAGIGTQISALQTAMQTYATGLANGTLTGTDATAAVDAMQSLGGQIQTLQGTIVTNNASIEALTQSNLSATAAVDSNKSASIAGAGSLLNTIQGFTPGTDLSSIGLSAGILSSVGLDPATAAALEGSSPAAIAAEQAANGTGLTGAGSLTPAQLASAQAGYAAQNANLTSQATPLEAEIASYQSTMPSLSTADQATAQAAILTLAGQLATLESTIQGDTAATTALTTATVASTTSSTGQMTGTVGYSYNSQGYTAGSNMTSDSGPDIEVGL